MALTHSQRDLLLQFIQTHQLKITHKIGWNNFTKNNSQPEALVLTIQDIPSLQAIVKEIYRLNNDPSLASDHRITYRAAGGGRDIDYSQSFSLTACAVSDIIFHCTGPDFLRISKTDDENVFEVGGSLQIGELHQKLYYQHDKVLSTASLNKYPTMAGLTALACHGTGRGEPSISGLFSSMTFMLENGEIVTLNESQKEYRVLCSAHLGMLGIMLGGQIRCIPAKKLRATIDVTSLAEYLEKVRAGIFTHNKYTSVMYMPTYQPDELTNHHYRNCVIYTFEPVDKNTPNHGVLPVFRDLAQRIQVDIADKFNVGELLSEVPELIPHYMRYIATTIAIGLKDRVVVGDWPETWHYQTAFPDDINDLDVLVPVRSPDTIINAFTKLATTLNEYAKAKSYPVTFAAYGRYFSPNPVDKGLSPGVNSSQQDVFAFDIVSGLNLKGFEAFRSDMFGYLVGQEEGKPHWGKYKEPGLNFVKMYGADYTEALSAFYSRHGMRLERSAFLNRFMCEVLNRPDLMPVETHVPAMPVVSKRSVPVMAAAFLVTIQGTHPEASELRRRVRECMLVKVTSSVSSLFDSEERDDKSKSSDMERVDTQEATKKSCCVLI